MFTSNPLELWLVCVCAPLLVVLSLSRCMSQPILLTELGSDTQCAVELTIRSNAWCFVSPITSRARIGLASSSRVSDQAVSGDLRRPWVWSNTLELCLICASACDCALVLL